MSVPELAGAPAAVPREPARPARTDITAGSSRWLAWIGVLSAVGLVIRFVVARESLFADELSTYWIAATHGLHGVLSLIYGTASVKHAEITPPGYFVASWLTLHLGHTPLSLRLPSLVAGTLSIPAIYLLGARTVGRRAAIVAAAITTVSPFMVYYSTEARAYAVMMLLVTASTLAMLLAIDTGRRRWWVGYAVCASLAFWTHYTCAFVLGAQLLWVLWAHPQARRPALLASLGAALGVLPWLPGLLNELGSPTVKILSDLSPFNANAVWVILGHWTVGYPYGALARMTQVPGPVALVLIALAVALTAAGLAFRHLRPKLPALQSHPAPQPHHAAERSLPPARTPTTTSAGWGQDRVLLLVVLLLATPVAEALISSVSTHIFGLRNLAASWPELGLLSAAILLAAGQRIGIAAAALMVLGLGLGAERMISGAYGRPDYQAAANLISQDARPGDVILDETGDLSPGPLTGLDVALRRPVSIVRALAPEERDHPFTLLDPYVSVPDATQRAITVLGPGGRVLVVGGDANAATLAANAGGTGSPGAMGSTGAPASSYRRVAIGRYAHVSVAVYARSGATSG